MIRLGATLGLILALASCAVGGALPVTDDPAGTTVRETETVSGADGAPLATSAWRAALPRAVILAVHGFGDYGPSTFQGAATYWAGRGLTTYAYDQRGFGRNPSRGRWPGVDALVQDLVAVSRQIRQRHPCLPLIVVGHSMGGGVTLAAAARGLTADGMVLAAPAVWGGARLNPLHRLAAWSAAAMVPERRFSGRGLVRIQASDNIEALKALARDPLYLSPPSARELMGLIRVMDAAEATAPRVSLPILSLLGEKDQIAKNELIEEVVALAPGRHSTVRYPEGWHLLFRDLQAHNVWRDVADWVERIRPPGAGCAGPAGASVSDAG